MWNELMMYILFGERGEGGGERQCPRRMESKVAYCSDGKDGKKHNSGNDHTTTRDTRCVRNRHVGCEELWLLALALVDCGSCCGCSCVLCVWLAAFFFQ